MKTLSRVVALQLAWLLPLLLSSLLYPLMAMAGSVVEVRPDSPIIQLPDKNAASVLIDADRKIEFDDLRGLADRLWQRYASADQHARAGLDAARTQLDLFTPILAAGSEATLQGLEKSLQDTFVFPRDERAPDSRRQIHAENPIR